ncbi:dTDP-4-dehydrorhamnose reductase [Streptomyces sp. NPDC021356]|uniref:dTDP-4-dehydrorhamnose reductase n=1 Tax=Streptomyces sp. NPDC021356 TaxID=3154900 RepID=UPI0033E9CABC
MKHAPVALVYGQDVPDGALRWLVTGATGKLGRDVVSVLGQDPTAEVTALSKSDLDITDSTAVTDAVTGHHVVVNAAAWTDVDGAETAEAIATTVNGAGVRHLAEACAWTGARLLHISTDYVFSGASAVPYGEDSPTSPVNAYGRSKLAGERAVARLLPVTGYTVRTAWLYGRHGRDFVTNVLELAGRRETLDVVDDQYGQPTWSHALAAHLVQLGRTALAGQAPAGIYHGTASGRTTWFGLARAAFELAGLDPERIRPTASAAFVRAAERPAFGVLSHDRWQAAGLAPLPHWRISLAEAFRLRTFTAASVGTPGLLPDPPDRP